MWHAPTRSARTDCQSPLWLEYHVCLPCGISESGRSGVSASASSTRPAAKAG